MGDSPTATDGKLIHVIEDETAMIDLVRIILEKRGYRVVGTSSGQEGLEQIREQVPDLILLDLMMPEMGGWDVYHQLKADPATKSVPVIIVTAKAASIDRVLGLHIAKVDDYVTKPFTPSDLLASIEKVLAQAIDE